MTTDLTIITNEESNKKEFIACEVKTAEEKKKLFNALNKCDKILNDCVGEEMMLANAYIECKEVSNEETGEITKDYKTIIFDDKGTSYVTKSYSFYRALSTILQIYDISKEPIKIKIIKKEIDKVKKALSLELI